MSYDFWKEMDYKESKERARRDYPEFLELQRKCGINLDIDLEEWVSAWEDERYEIMKALEKLSKMRTGSRMRRMANAVKYNGAEALLNFDKNKK